MKLIQTTTERDQQTYVSCIKCGKRELLSRMWANLDGLAFRAYYCHGCKDFARDNDGARA